MNNETINWRKGIFSTSPILVFLAVYLVVSLVTGDFYKMPLSVAFLIASIWAVCTMEKLPLSQRVEIFSKEAGSNNVIYMVWIFILAGAFATIARKTGAVDATVDLTLSLLPPFLIVPGLFLATCFVSMAIGTSVGTVVALTPLAVDMATLTGDSIPFFVAIVLGGAFFGDNLSFISDTTIAATRTQGCDMRQKFRANFRIVLPAALLALLMYCLFASQTHGAVELHNTPRWLVLPYLVVIGCALGGLNVMIVLFLGILSTLAAGLIIGIPLLDLFSTAGEGIDSVGGLIVITLLAAGMLGIIKYTGGIEFILQMLSRNIGSSRGAQLSIVLLVGLVNFCTANNTVAILTVGSLARKIAEKYGISAKKSASLLDTGSCVVQALIPYGAQTLMATSIAGISPEAPWRWLFYPQALIICLGVSILIVKRKTELDAPI